MDFYKPMASTDLEEFNDFLDTWMQDTDDVSMPAFLPAEVYSTPMGATNEELAQFQMQQDQMQSAFLAGDAFETNVFGKRTLVDFPVLPEQEPSFRSHSSMSSQQDTAPLKGMRKVESADTIEPAFDPKLDTKKSKVLEKNRRAQKRFRDKQKNKMSDMEEQLESLQKSLEAVTLEKSTYIRQNEVLNKVLELRQSQINELTETARITESVEEQEDKRQFDLAAVPLVIQCKPGPMLSRFSSIEDVRRMGGKDAVLTWRACVERMESLLAQIDSSESNADAMMELEQAMQEAGWFAQTLSIVNPHAIKVVITTNQDTMLPDEVLSKDPVFWGKAAGPLQLSSEQRDRIMFLARGLKIAITRSATERQTLATELQELLPFTCGTDGNLTACIRTSEVIALLRKSFQTEHEAWCTFTATILAKILSPVQFARFSVDSSPLFPNALQLARHVFSTSDKLPAGTTCDRQLCIGLPPQNTPTL